MKLSIVIVNYNVKHFISQCLYSINKAKKDIDCEVIVVDNNSVDGSCYLIKEKFPEVKLLENKKNVGFAKANNQAIKIAKGKYILLLNPDTVLEENTLSKCIEFMKTHEDAGALGVKMINGKGQFLPESKRALPTPKVAFYKMFGLSALFPKSKEFGKYHLTYLKNNETNVIEVLSGAFMFMRKKVLDEVGLLDEDYFMYGEDIDLSYRIIKAGYKNYYFPGTTIIHYKGESTKKSSINYVIVFYKAMIIFATKQLSKKKAKLFSFLINMAIYFRAFLSLIKRFIKSLFYPLIDAGAIFAGYYFGIPLWEKFRFTGQTHYEPIFLKFVVPSYILVWIFANYITGGYEKPVKIFKNYRGFLIGTLIILIVYALLPEEYRFSRALILFGTGWILITVTITRILLSFTNINDFKLNLKKKKRIVVVGNKKEAHRVESLINQIQIRIELVGLVATQHKNSDSSCLGHIDQLEEIIKINKIDEIIFCASDLSSEQIITKMLQFADNPVDYKIAPPESLSIIGSNSINTAGDLYDVHFNSITKDKNKRKKRLLDFSMAFLLLIFCPVAFLFVSNRRGFLKNILLVLAGSYSWVGYIDDGSTNVFSLPKIKKGILHPGDGLPKKEISDILKNKINILYTKDYKIIHDLNIIYKGRKNLGRKKH